MQLLKYEQSKRFITKFDLMKMPKIQLLIPGPIKGPDKEA